MFRAGILATVACAGLLGVIHWSGCSSSSALIDTAVHEDRFDFNEVIIKSWNEQLLLNIVRLRYRDNPLFLDIGSVITAYALKASVGAEGSLLWSVANVQGISGRVGGEYTTAPTLTYVPLQGEAYTARLLSPIQPAVLLYLSQSGWSFERLLTLCAQKVNGVLNAPTASGPTPDSAPEFEEFQRLAESLRALQLRYQIAVTADSGARNIRLYILDRPDGSVDPDAEKVRTILGLPRADAPYRVTPALFRSGDDEIAIMGRTLVSVMYFLANAVEVPREHADAGMVTLTRTSAGEPFDWRVLMDKVFRVSVSPTKSDSAFVQVRYRDHWFFIDDRDLNSKSTFALLTHLFNLKSSEEKMLGPLLTVPVR